MYTNRTGGPVKFKWGWITLQTFASSERRSKQRAASQGSTTKPQSAVNYSMSLPDTSLGRTSFALANDEFGGFFVAYQVL